VRGAVHAAPGCLELNLHSATPGIALLSLHAWLQELRRAPAASHLRWLPLLQGRAVSVSEVAGMPATRALSCQAPPGSFGCVGHVAAVARTLIGVMLAEARWRRVALIRCRRSCSSWQVRCLAGWLADGTFSGASSTLQCAACCAPAHHLESIALFQQSRSTISAPLPRDDLALFWMRATNSQANAPREPPNARLLLPQAGARQKMQGPAS
jgi:hypothetical protein